jgi:hypothetical protein
VLLNNLEGRQRDFYRKKYQEYGDDPRSLSWNDRKSQFLRFDSLCDLFRFENNDRFSVHEVGCGLGHFLEYLHGRDLYPVYSGSDIVPEFIEQSKKKFPDAEFYLENIASPYDEIEKRIKNCDYYCLSGTFNPKGDVPLADWENFIHRSISNMFRMARKGICFNFLTSYSDFKNPELYYADPRETIDYCIRHLSRFVAMSQTLPLFEFTVLVYRQEYIRKLHPGFTRYFRGKR